MRAFDARTGEQLWEDVLDDNVNANVMTYLDRNGRQHVAAVAGETLVAYSLP